MYNDYYLQQRDSKLATTNTQLSTIIINQGILNEQIQKGAILITMVMSIYLIWYFIVRCFK